MDNNELLELAQKGDKEARNRLVQENIGLVWNIVKRFLGRGHEAEDLFQIGCIGLIKAIDKFDLNYDVKLSTYAVPMIMGEIKRFIRDDGMVKVSRTIKENNIKVMRARQELTWKYGREPKTSELGEVSGLSIEEVLEAIEGSFEVESIYKPIKKGEENEVCLIDKIAQKNSGGNHVDDIINNIAIRQAIDELVEEERRIIELRYFRDMTQCQVAKIMGISQVQVSRMEKKILVRLRHHIEK